MGGAFKRLLFVQTLLKTQLQSCIKCLEKGKKIQQNWTELEHFDIYF